MILLIFQLQLVSFLQILKLRKSYLLYKKESKLDFSNYRPILLLSNLDKIDEKPMYNRVTDFLEKNNIIYPLQFGFRKNYSTTHTII